jgi:4-amino-4-deoxy-L-arabinose transferase-like glycosyltransferase
MARITQQDLGSVLKLLWETGRSPGYVVLGTITTHLFGITEFGLRALSALASTAAIAAMYAVGRELIGKIGGIIGALAMTLSLFQLYYAQEHRYYALLVLFTLLAALFYVRMLKSDRLKDYLFYVIFSVLIVYTHLFGAFVLAGWGLYFLLRWRKYYALWRRWLLSQVVILVLILPTVWGQFVPLAADTEPEHEALSRPTAATLVFTLRNFVFFGSGYLENRTLTIFIIASSIALSIAIIGRRKNYRFRLFQNRESIRPQGLWQEWEAFIFAIFWLFSPIIIIFVVSFIFSPIYLDRYLITASPGLYLLIAFLLIKIGRFIPIVVMASVLIMTMAYPLYRYDRGITKEQWRETAAYVRENIQDGDVIPQIKEDIPLNIRMSTGSFYWYYGGEPSSCMVDLALGNLAIESQMGQCLSKTHRVWAIIRDREGGVQRMEDFVQFMKESYEEGVGLITKEKFVGTLVYLLQFP